MRRLIGLAVLVVCAVTAAQAQINTKHFPADAKWMLHLDLKALSGAPMGQFVRQSLDENAQRGLATFQSVSGINLTNDIDSLVVYGKGDLQAGGVLYAYGRFDVAKLTAIAGGAKEFQNKVCGEHSLLSWTDKGKRTNLCFIDPTLAILSQNEQQVQDAVALVSGQSGMGDDGPFASVLASNKGRFFAVQANNIAALVGKNPQLQMFKQAEAVRLEVSQLADANGLECTLVVKAASKELSQQLGQAAQGIQAILLLQEAQNPDAAALARGIRVAQQDDFVTVSLKVTEAVLTKQIQLRREQGKKSAEARKKVAAGAEKRDGKAARPEFDVN